MQLHRLVTGTRSPVTEKNYFFFVSFVFLVVLVLFFCVVDGDRGTTAEAEPLLGAALGARNLNDAK